MAEDGPRARLAAETIEALGYARVLWLDASIRGAAGRGARPRAGGAALATVALSRDDASLGCPMRRRANAACSDLAAGAGREAVFLAQRGYRVEAWDHDRGALENAQALALAA